MHTHFPSHMAVIYGAASDFKDLLIESLKDTEQMQHWENKIRVPLVTLLPNTKQNTA